ncbi:MAG: class I SAM-dependent methyltransferase [Tateyamaria sp.]|uniref:class I SAM-dependent methyltransferase n=1 Tax=Tateyamaria sp. TaxID=1929288 RepID=UPI00329C197F
MSAGLKDIFEQRKGKASDKWEHYFRVYEPLFATYRFQPITLLEIGVQNGGSLEVWAQYFENAKNIIGLDIDPKVGDLQYEDPRIRAVVSDGTLSQAVEDVGCEFFPADIVIDDGSHYNDHVIKSFLLFFPLLADGGVYVVEDTHTSYFAEHGGHLFCIGSMMTFFQRLSDIINREHWDGALSVEDALHPLLDMHSIPAKEFDWIDHIHSIAFTNSMIIIEKRAAGITSLGQRCASGTIETVVEGLTANAGQPYVRHAQAHPSYPSTTPETDLAQLNSDLAVAKAALEQTDSDLVETRAELVETRAELARVCNSLSWRLTKPFRRIFGKGS